MAGRNERQLFLVLVFVVFAILLPSLVDVKSYMELWVNGAIDSLAFIAILYISVWSKRKTASELMELQFASIILHICAFLSLYLYNNYSHYPFGDMYDFYTPALFAILGAKLHVLYRGMDGLFQRHSTTYNADNASAVRIFNVEADNMGQTEDETRG